MYFTYSDNRLSVRNGGELLWIEPWGAGVRVRATPESAMPEESGALDEPVETPPATCSQTPDGGRVLETASVVAEISPTGRLTFRDRGGRLLLEEFVRNSTPPRKSVLRIPAREFRPHTAGWFSLAQRFESDPDERLWGMGQYQQPNFDLKGCELELVQRNSQTTVPFVVSSRGYGMLWNNPAQGSVVFGRNVTTWRATSSLRLDYWLVAGASPAEILLRYADVTGHTPAMPEWALGFWQSKCRYRTQEELLSVARRHHALGIPLSAIVIDYFHWVFEGDLDFDREYWPDPAAMVRELRGMGVEPVVSVWPTVDERSRHRAEMQGRGFLVRAMRGPDEGLCLNARTQTFDATNPAARAWFWARLRETYGAYGIRSFWLDIAEPETTTPDPDNFLFHAGPAARVANRYPRDYGRMVADGLRAEGHTPFVSLCRSAWAGSQKFGVLLWSGDIPSTFWALRNQISIGLSAGMAGIPWWNCDIGGFFDGDSRSPVFRELLLRWFAFGTFTPVMRLHGTRLPEEPGPGATGGGACGSGAPNEVWSYGPEAEEILVSHIRLRERLRPYLRLLFREASETGAPLMRPMFWHYPDDEACRDVSDQYLFGRDLLVAPVVEPDARSRTLRLPAGDRWVDVRTGETFEGGRTLVASAPLSSIPVFLREGADNSLFGVFPTVPGYAFTS